MQTHDDQQQHNVLPPQFSSFEEYALALVSFLKKYEFLFNFYLYNDDRRVVYEERVVHFLVNNQWENKMPLEWQNSINHCTFHDLMLLSQANLSILDKVNSQSFRDFVNEAVQLYMVNNITDNEQSENSSPLNKILMKGVKLKKRYEIEKLGKTIIQYAHETKCDTIVDIGSGQGYVSQYVSFANFSDEEKQNIQIIAIDGNELQTRGANKRVEMIEKTLKTQSEKQVLHNITAHLSLDIDQDQFLELVRPYLCSSDDQELHRILLIGLHTCGDLSPSMMQIFLQTDAVALINVGCCYHKLTEDPELFCSHDCSRRTVSRIGYPLSSILKSEENKLHLSTGKYLACYTLPDYKDVHTAKHQFKMHSYRAALELFLHLTSEFKSSKEPECHFAGHVPNGNTNSFAQYAVYALQKMGDKLQTYDYASQEYKNVLDVKLRELLSQDKQELDDTLSQFYQQLNPIEGDIILPVQAWCAIRSLLSPVLEALILVDRLLYLKEQPNVVKAQLLRVFDSRISPRGFILTAEKETEQ
jgi:hypothetical protein